jgi:hypothetical protein
VGLSTTKLIAGVVPEATETVISSEALAMQLVDQAEPFQYWTLEIDGREGLGEVSASSVL